MKAILTISLMANLILIVFLSFMLVHDPLESDASAPSKRIEPKLTTVAVASSPRQLVVKPFQWNQLEASDYRTYVQNLRNSGCPELTLHAIVRADVDVVYRQRGEKLQCKLADLVGSSSWSIKLSSLAEQQALKAELQRLPAEEDMEIANLLGLKSTLAGNVASSVASTPTPNVTILMPLVFQKVDLTPLNLNEEQRQAITGMQQQFIEMIGGYSQNLDDPGYRERWQKAQPEMDDMMRGMLGVTVFEDYQLAAQTSASPGEH